MSDSEYFLDDEEDISDSNEDAGNCLLLEKEQLKEIVPIKVASDFSKLDFAIAEREKEKSKQLKQSKSDTNKRLELVRESIFKINL